MKNLNTISFVNLNPSFIINLIDRDDGKKQETRVGDDSSKIVYLRRGC